MVTLSAKQGVGDHILLWLLNLRGGADNWWEKIAKSQNYAENSIHQKSTQQYSLEGFPCSFHAYFLSISTGKASSSNAALSTWSSLSCPGPHHFKSIKTASSPMDHWSLHQWLTCLHPWITCVNNHGSLTTASWPTDHSCLYPWITYNFAHQLPVICILTHGPLVFTHKSLTFSHISCQWFVSWPMDHLRFDPWTTCVFTHGSLASWPVDHLCLHPWITYFFAHQLPVIYILTHGSLASWPMDHSCLEPQTTCNLYLDPGITCVFTHRSLGLSDNI